MEDGDYEREYELLSEMTWTDEIFESHNQQIEDSDDQTSEDQEQDLPQEELEVLNQLIEDIKELKVVQECQKIEQELSNTNVNLVSTSKDAKIEISWSLFNEWEKDCRKLTEVEDKEG